MKTRPKCLRCGDLVGVMAPSSPASTRFPKRFKFAVRALERELGVRVLAGRSVTTQRGFVSLDAEARAEEFQRFVQNSDMRAIFTTIGGFNSAEILPYLDKCLLRENAKILVGYSDTTALLLGVQAIADWVTFHGPAVMTQFGEFPRPHSFTVNHLKQVLMTSGIPGCLPFPDEWTNEFLEWGDSSWKTRARLHQPASPPSVWRSGLGSGTSFGGNMETMNLLIGTPFFIAPASPIFFWEATAEEAYLPRIRRALTQLRQSGFLSSVVAMLVGRCPDARPEGGVDLRQTILEATDGYSFPIVGDIPIGHTDPTLTLPIGCRMTVDCRGRDAIISVDDAGVVA